MGPQDNRIFSASPTMNFKLTFVLLGLVALVGVQGSVIPIEQSEAPEVGIVYADVYDGSNETGNKRTITSYMPNLGNAGLGSAISSSCSTGMPTQFATLAATQCWTSLPSASTTARDSWAKNFMERPARLTSETLMPGLSPSLSLEPAAGPSTLGPTMAATVPASAIEPLTQLEAKRCPLHSTPRSRTVYS